MTNQEMVDKIVNKAGITREQAEDALEKNGGDLLEAMIYVEKTYKNGDSATSYSYAANRAESENANPTQPFYYNPQPQPQTDFNSGCDVKEQPVNPSFNGKNFLNMLQRILEISVKNGITIHYNDAEIITIPVLVWAVLFFSSISSLVVLMFITMFFNVSYSFKGNELGSEKFNKVLRGIYEFAQGLKAKILN